MAKNKKELSEIKKEFNKKIEENESLRLTLKEQIINEKLNILKISENKFELYFGRERIKAEYSIDKIIFENTGDKECRIYFGNQNAIKKKYDIENFRDYIEKENIDQCNLKELVIFDDKTVLKKEKFNFKLIFNILIMTVSVLMVVIIIFKIRENI